jgi:cbb3-type cytochrome oxidase cytochrome c subunit
MSEPRQNRFGLAHLIAFLAGVVFFALSFVLLAIVPGRRLEDEMNRAAPITMSDYTSVEARGRAIYAREGCAYCHTEQVRGTQADVTRWGPATEAWETRYDYPQVWGTRRIGPDLSREGGVRSDDWQTTHLFNPRWIVPGSIMPAYPWLFDRDPSNPNADGRAVLAYMQTLGRAMRQAKGSTAFCPTPQPKVIKAGFADKDNSKPGPAASITFKDGMAMGGSIDANAAIRRLDTPYPDLAAADPGQDLAARRGSGKTVFAQYCSGCHGAYGAGDGPAAASLLPHPANLNLAVYSNAALADVLWNGRPGTSMPAWRDLRKDELADVVAYVQSLHAPNPPASKPESDEARNALLARGAEVYAKGCIACHGVEGNGRGPVAHVFLPRPANLEQIKPDRARVMQALAEGIPGASMPVFSGLSPSDRIAVAAYVATLSSARKAP